MTSQWAQPTLRNLFMRVCAMNSMIICLKRGKNGRHRSGADWPMRTVLNILSAPERKMYQHTKLSRAPIVPNVIVRAFMSRPFVSGRRVGHLGTAH